MNDIDAVDRVAEIADAPFELPLREALAEGTAGSALRVGLRTGPQGYLIHMANQFQACQQTVPMRPYLDAAMVLVAEHGEQGVLGGLLAYPPFDVTENVIAKMESAGLPADQGYLTLVNVGMHLVRIKALGVAEFARGARIGSALLKMVSEGLLPLWLHHPLWRDAEHAWTGQLLPPCRVRRT